jgi:squalene synthase HpnC
VEPITPTQSRPLGSVDEGLRSSSPAPARQDTDLWSSLPAAYRIPEHAPSLTESQRYCERLARSHYENFSVASWFLPKRLRQHFFNVYAYCRISDDLGDEVGDPAKALALLNIWEEELDATYLSLVQAPLKDVRCDVERLQPGPSSVNPSGPRHPVFVALGETIREFDIPHCEFANLLRAFRQDQSVTRYETFEDLLGYCKNSANPVGHLVLYLCGYSDSERQQLSDYTCTALQLANFWQDVRVDWDKGRVYLPLESLHRFGVREDDIAQGRCTAEFRNLMRFEVARARDWFERGLPLVKKVDRELAIDLELFTRGGQEILNAIEHQGFDVLARRPAISKPRKLWLLMRAAAGKLSA